MPLPKYVHIAFEERLKRLRAEHGAEWERREAEETYRHWISLVRAYPEEFTPEERLVAGLRNRKICAQELKRYSLYTLASLLLLGLYWVNVQEVAMPLWRGWQIILVLDLAVLAGASFVASGEVP